MNRIHLLVAKSREELKTAEMLLENNYYSATISRAYYSLYHIVQALLETKSINVKSHKGLIQQFGQHFIKTGEMSPEFSKILITTFDLRQLSDYDETTIITYSQAKLTVDNTRNFITFAESLLTEQL